MNLKHAAVVVCLAVVGSGAVAWLLATNPPAKRVETVRESPLVAVKAEIPAAPQASAPESQPSTLAPLPARKTAVRGNDSKPAEVAQVEPSITINGYVLEDPLPRLALYAVGSDREAEGYWIGAINDSAVPAEERKDLIEDLNEVGLSDPRHPSAQDTPVILRRVRLIEQLAPTALDDVNRDAFAEAYQDLVGLLNGQEPK